MVLFWERHKSAWNQKEGSGREDMEYLATGQEMSLMDKLGILTDAAKYDVACTSSGVDRKGNGQGIGNSVAAGICHSFSSDGR